MDKSWQEFITFRDWALTNGYRDNLTIDRINSNKGYYPENCHWISLSENVSKRNVENPKPKVANVSNIPKMWRDYDDSEHLWARCRINQHDSEFVMCNECNDRFRCWTASRPKRIQFIDHEMNYSQMELRITGCQPI